MAILTDFVVAASDEGVAIGESSNPADTWPTRQFKSVDTIKLCTLYCAIEETPCTDELPGMFPLVGGNQEVGPWVFQFSTKALLALANLQEASVPGVAKKWAATEELEMDGWDESDAEEVIVELSAHARLAASSHKSLFLWLSL